MGPWDARLSVLAAEARVRTSHVHHLLAALAEPNFTVAAFALFTGLEARHVERIIAALEQNGLVPQPKRRNGRASNLAHEKPTRLPPDFQVPIEWIRWAQTEKGWPQDVAETQALRFVDHWLGAPPPKALKSNWQAVWRNWVRSPYAPESGAYTSRDVDPLTPEQQRERVREHAEFLARIGRE